MRSCAHKVPTVYKTISKFHSLRLKNNKVHKMEKVTKNNLTVISKPHGHPHTVKKTAAKFQKDPYKTVRGVALTKDPVSMLTDGRTDGRKLARLNRPC